MLLTRASPFLDSATLVELRTRLATDRRVQLSRPFVHVGIDADGWARSELEVRVLQTFPPIRRMTLRCRHHAPMAGLLRIDIDLPGAPGSDWMRVDGNGEFLIELPVHESRAGQELVFRLHTQGGFVPAHVEAGSRDSRELAFLVDEVTLDRAR